jgi:hypothetical protein
MAKKQRRTVRKPAAKRPARKPTVPQRKPAKPKSAASGSTSLSRETHVQRAVKLLEFAHQTVLDCLKAWPEDKLAYQAVPTDNHPLWTLGHLTLSYSSWFGKHMGVTMPAVPASYEGLFGHETKPIGDASKYPPLEEIKAAYIRAVKFIIDAAQRMSDEQLYEPIAEQTHGFARDRLDMIEKAAWHEGWHAGQLSSLRRVLGLPSIYG